MTAEMVRKALKELADPETAKNLQWFFKTGPGQYGEGDVFIGIKVPPQRKVARRFLDLPLTEFSRLIRSKIHEHRLTALLIACEQYKRASDAKTKKAIYTAVLAETAYINNWDLVDSVAPALIGPYLLETGGEKKLFRLAKSRDLWERRIAIVATYAYIRAGRLEEVFGISEILLPDQHDLIHKAVGWMLREAGKVDMARMEAFLAEHYDQLPRTTLRYAIERIEESRRKAWLRGPLNVF